MQHPDDQKTDDWVYSQTGMKRDRDEYIKQHGKAHDSDSRREANEHASQAKAKRGALYRRIKRQISFDFL